MTLASKPFTIIASLLLIGCFTTSIILFTSGRRFRKEHPNAWARPKFSHNRVVLVSDKAKPIRRAYLFNANDPKAIAMECTNQEWFADVPSDWNKVSIKVDADEDLDRFMITDKADRILLGMFDLTDEELQIIIVPEANFPPSLLAKRDHDDSAPLFASRGDN